MKDKILISTAYNNEVRIYLAYTKKLVEETRIIHNAEPTSIAALGRLLTALSMMQYMYKDVYFLSMKIEGNGPLNYLIAESLKQGTVRGTLSNPGIHIVYNDTNKLAVGKAIGEGLLTVRREDKQNTNYTSSTKLVNGEIGEDLTYYFLHSEQTYSSVGLGVLVDTDKSIKQAGGFIIQLLPNASEKTISALEENLKNITSVTALLDNNNTLEDILKLLTSNNYQILEEHDIKYECGCNKDYYLNVLTKLNDETLLELENDDTTEIVCHYCNKKYLFDKDDFKKIKNLKLSLNNNQTN